MGPRSCAKKEKYKVRTISLRKWFVVFSLHATSLTVTVGNSGDVLSITLNEEFWKDPSTSMMILVQVKISPLPFFFFFLID